ncbi:MAG: hypothetical protein HRU40_16005 [Saprospiraceae bacterium]|nr:hypothetical protein [Saprospiraceae bacterium]
MMNYIHTFLKVLINLSVFGTTFIRLGIYIFFLSLASSASLFGQSLGLTGLTPSQFKCGEAISPGFQIQLLDAMGNPDLMAGISITATVSAGSGMVSSGGSVNTDANGIADFSSLIVTNSSGPIQLTFSDGTSTYSALTTGTLNETPSVGADQPTVTLSSSLYCTGDPAITVTIGGSLNDADQWVLYTGSCGGTQVDMTVTNSLSITPSATTTYYLRGEGTCVNDGACQSFEIVYSDLQLTAPVSGTTFCMGDEVNFSYTSTGSYGMDNTFLLQMSNASGDFTNPVTVGSLPSTSASGMITGVIPFVDPGSGYKFQIISTDPAMPEACTNASTYTIDGVNITTQPVDDLECLGEMVSFSATATGATAYQWERIDLVPFTVRPGGLGTTAVSGVARSITTGNIYAATSDGLYRSTDDGNNFSQIATTSTTGPLPSNMLNAVDVRGNIVIVATNSGLAYSTNDGVNFTIRNTSSGLGSNTVSDVFIDQAGNYYAATAGGLSISTDGGSTFTNYTNSDGLGSSSINDVYVEGADAARTIYAATTAGVSIARSGSTSFTNYDSGLGSPNVNAISVNYSGTIYAATNGGIGVSYDGGYNFTNIVAGLADANVTSITTDNDLIFAGTLGGLAVATFGADRFSNYDVDYGLPVNAIAGMLTTTSMGVSTLYVGTAGGFAKTTMTISDIPGATSPTLAFTLADTDANDRYRLKVFKGSCERYTNIVRTHYVPPTISFMVDEDLTECDLETGVVQITGLLPSTEYRLVRTGTLTGLPENQDNATTDTLGLIE